MGRNPVFDRTQYTMEYVLGEYMNDIKKRLVNILHKYGVINYEIDYYPKIFGNIICKFEYKGKKYDFVTDRGEIILNNKSICNIDCFDPKLLTIDILEKRIIEILEK